MLPARPHKVWGADSLGPSPRDPLLTLVPPRASCRCLKPRRPNCWTAGHANAEILQRTSVWHSLPAPGSQAESCASSDHVSYHACGVWLVAMGSLIVPECAFGKLPARFTRRVGSLPAPLAAAALAGGRKARIESSTDRAGTATHHNLSRNILTSNNVYFLSPQQTRQLPKQPRASLPRSLRCRLSHQRLRPGSPGSGRLLMSSSHFASSGLRRSCSATFCPCSSSDSQSQASTPFRRASTAMRC